MKTRNSCLICVLLAFVIDHSSLVIAAPAAPRVIVLADMGNEPDEEQQMVHLLLYANELDIEGLIAVTGKFLRKDPQPELFFHLIDGYDRVVENLRLHAEGWPSAGELQATVAAGQRRYGIADAGPGRASPGSRLIEKILLRDDPRPVHIIINAGSNTLAQTLLDLEERLPAEEFAAVLAKIRAFENGAQDNAGAWIVNRWPAVHWIRSNYQTYAYGGPSIDGGEDNRGRRNELGPYTWAPYEYSGLGQHQWALMHLKGNHGPLMERWPIRQFPRGGVSFLEGGGTIPFLRLLPNGLNNPDEPTWGGWGGRYGDTRTRNVWSKHRDVRVDEEKYGDFHMFDELNDTWTDPESGTTYTEHNFAPVWRWRDAFFRDFAARADWCLNDFDHANHAPVIHAATATRNDDTINLSVEVSDPDRNSLHVTWWIYPEAGTYRGETTGLITNAHSNHATITLPPDLGDNTLHVILEVTDSPREGEHPMTSYQRLIIGKSK